MAPSLDFNATLAEQLRDAGMQMRAMTKPQKQRQHEAPTQEDAQEHAPEQTLELSQEQSCDPLSNQSRGQSHGQSRDPLHDQSDGQSHDQSRAEHTSAYQEDAAVPTVTTIDTVTQGMTGGQTDKQADVQTDGQAVAQVPPVTAHETTATAVTNTGDTTGSTTGDTTAQDAAMHTAQAASTSTVSPSDTLAVTVSALGEAHATASVTTPATTSATARATAPVSDCATVCTAGAAKADSLAENMPQGSSGHDSLPHGLTHNAANSHAHTHSDGHDSDGHDSAAHDSTGNSVRNSELSTDLPDAASELWAMSHHSAAPTLSERSWTGGVRGAVLDALRGLAGGQGHVLVNLKRLATHTGISYGSVRNAMSRLTRSGDILTRQIRMADGHGVRVEFLTLPGQEGTRAMPTMPSGRSGQSAQSGQFGPASGSSMPAAGQTVTRTVGMTAYAQSMTPHSAPSPYEQGTEAHYPAQAGSQAAAQQHFQSAPPSHLEQAQAMTAQGHWQDQAVFTTDTVTAGHAAAASGAYAATQASAHANAMPNMPNMQSMPNVAMASFAAPSTVLPAASASPALPAFWQTDDSLFACAWPHVAAAGLGMALLRGLAPIFAVQGFDAAVLPRCLRYLDWELENMGVSAEMTEPMPATSGTEAPSTHDASITLEAAHQLTQAFMRTLQRRGSWPRPALYEEGED